jgi:predicted secreted Zn-dependent protease
LEATVRRARSAEGAFHQRHLVKLSTSQFSSGHRHGEFVILLLEKPHAASQMKLENHPKYSHYRNIIEHPIKAVSNGAESLSRRDDQMSVSSGNNQASIVGFPSRRVARIVID